MYQNIIIFNSEYGTMTVSRVDDVQFVLTSCLPDVLYRFFLLLLSD